MPGSLYLPTQVKESIAAHIRRAVANAVEGFDCAAEDEDTVTGDLGATLRIRRQRVHVVEDEIPGVWTWEMTYGRMAGGEAGATEKRTGADGIFELRVEWPDGRRQLKSLLFQAKKEWHGTEPRLLSQALNLSNWREAACIVNYSADAYDVFSIDQAVQARGIRAKAGHGIPLGTYLADKFVPCHVGDTDLQYIPQKHLLIWRSTKGKLVGANFSAKHIIRVTARPPKHAWRMPRVEQLVPTNEIHQHRMLATAQEMLGAGASKPLTPAEVKRVRRRLSIAYHPDGFTTVEQLLRDIAEARMKEMNAAADQLGGGS